MKGNSDDQTGTKNRTEGKWKRVTRKNQEGKVTSSDDNKENEMMNGNTRGLITVEGVLVDVGEVQGKRARTELGQNALNNDQVVVTSLE